MRSRVLPFTLALGLPDRFARRIARNTQLVLLEESNLAKVADPAAGSGGIEDLTEKLCGAAWTLFQEIEQAGGAWAALEQGLIQNKVAAVRAEREQAVAQAQGCAHRHQRFPRSGRSAGRVLDVRRCRGRRSAPPRVRSLPRIRLAEPFESCATPPTACSRRPARGRRCSSPISARPPNSPRARPSPRISSKPAASRR